MSTARLPTYISGSQLLNYADHQFCKKETLMLIYLINAGIKCEHTQRIL